MSDLAAMAVAIPITASVVAFLAGLVRERTGWHVAVLGCLVQVAIAGQFVRRALYDESFDYVVGGFETPHGIELVVDGLSATMIALIAVVSLGVLAYARAAGPRSNAFYATYMLLVAGLTGVSITGDLFNMYVFLEITGLAAYALVASGEGGRSATAALKYLLIGTVGASLFLLGLGYAYVATGTLNMEHMATQLADVGYDDTLVQAAFGFVVVGLFIKVAVFPLHTWQPDAYAGSPDTVSGFISALVSTVAAYALVRVVYDVFTPAFFVMNPLAQDMLLAAATVSIVVGSGLAVAQTEIKRMLAYSSVAQFGLVVAGVALVNETALVGAVVHLVGHAIMKGGLFLTAGIVAATTGARSVGEYDGLAERLPVGAGAFGVLALAMVGVPPAVGFVGKWYIAVGAVETESWALAAVIVASTLLTLAYFARLVERMFFRAPAVADETGAEGVAADGDGLAADGRGASDDGQRAPVDSDEVTTGGDDPLAPRAVSTGMYAVVVIAAVLAVALGAAVFEYGQLLEPTVDSLLDQ